MTDRNIRLTTRAFNNECDAAISNCTWKNITKMEERITKAFEDINKLNEQNHIYINTKYLNKKLEELWLTHEYREQNRKKRRTGRNKGTNERGGACTTRNRKGHARRRGRRAPL